MSRPDPEFSVSRSAGNGWFTHLALIALSGLAACQGDPAATGGSDSAPETTTSDSGSTASATTDAPTTGPDPATTTGAPTTGDPCPAGALGCTCLTGQICEDGLVCEDDLCVESGQGTCGDGVLGRDEACDAGRDNGPGKPCKADCTLNVCGDGDVGPGELCDDGNDLDDDACTNTCTLASCGDAIVQLGEECDDGNALDTDGCTQACTLAACGDGFIQPEAAEQCDAGADNGAGKACKGDCTINVCGDGDVAPGEPCDDGDAIDDDECTNTCTLASCGDGIVQQGEECDDADADDADACTQACTAAACGDGFTQPGNGETCDAGPDNGPGKACKIDCTLNVCGDGDVGPGELCDDADDDDLDACSNACTLASCGDGVAQAGEECDDANDVDTDACTSACTAAACGDGFVQPGTGEQCDAGPDNGPGKACKNDCTLNLCGDGDVGPGEECDDGDLEGGDGCSATCTPEACGNGVLDVGEECDDGDLEGRDGCSATCTIEGCGDGVLQPGEECDDGDLEAGDGCEPSCTWTPCAFLWQKIHKEPGVTRHSRRVATDASGNIAIVATRLPGLAESTMIALKLDPDGALSWTAQAIDIRMEGYGVAVTPGGAVIGVGVEAEIGVPLVRDLTRRFEPDGALGWLAHEVVPEPSFGYGAALAPDNGVILAGYRYLQTGDFPWVARVDLGTGAVAWTHLALPPGSTFAHHYAVTVDAAGFIYATGRVRIAGDMRLLVRKFNPAGVPQWMAIVDNTDFGWAEGRDIEAVPGGGVAVAGRFFYGDGNGGKTGGDIWVGVFDDAGSLVWSDLHDSGPGDTSDEGNGVAVDPDGHVHVAGIVRPDSTTRGVYRKYDASGALLCSVVVDPPANNFVWLNDVTIDPSGFPVVAGVSENSILVGKLTP